MFLGNVDQLGSEVKTAFVNTINSAVQKVVRGVLLTRPGFEEKAAVASNLQVGSVACPSKVVLWICGAVCLIQHALLPPVRCPFNLAY
jgi:hypothetical protein